MTDILLIATAKYKQFIPQMLDSLRHLKFPHRSVLFTDEPFDLADIEYKIEHEPFPYCSMFRYHYFNQVELTGDYQIYVDIDAKFVVDVGKEILGDLIAVRHCGYCFTDNLPQELSVVSEFYKYKFKKYYGGGMQGGRHGYFKAACEWMQEKINNDLGKGVIPRNHDETAWNAYLSIVPPTVELTSDFHFPEEVINRKPEWESARNHFVNYCWKGKEPFTPRLVLLKKEHESIR